MRTTSVPLWHGLTTSLAEPLLTGLRLLELRPLLSDAPLAAFMFSRQVQINPLEEDNHSFSALDAHLGSALTRQLGFDTARGQSADLSVLPSSRLFIHPCRHLVDGLMEFKSDDEKRTLLELANSHPELPPGYVRYPCWPEQPASRFQPRLITTPI